MTLEKPLGHVLEEQRRELQRAGRYVLCAKRLERAYFEANERRYAPGSVGETEAMLSFRAAAAPTTA